MMVDSDLITLKLAEKHFTSKGFKFIPVQDPHTILKLIKTGKPDIIIMAIELGKISGKNIIKALRKGGLKIPVIVLSSHINKKTILELKPYEVLGYFSKPVNLAKIEEKIHSIINPNKVREGSKSASPAVADKIWPPLTVLIITEDSNIHKDPKIIIPHSIIKKYRLRVFSESGFQDSVTVMKNPESNIKIIMVDAVEEEKIATMTRLLKVIETKLKLPVYFFSEKFSNNFQNTLSRMGFDNLIKRTALLTQKTINKFDSELDTALHGKKKRPTIRAKNILNELKSIKSLPPMPEIYIKIEKISHDHDATSKDYAKILELDPSITARLLRISNSAFYSFKRKIKSVKDTVTVMGTREVLSLVRLTCITGNLKTKKDVEAFVNKVWEHSAACSITAKLLYEKTDFSKTEKLAEDLFICGVIHDIGKVVLWDFFPDIYMPFMLNPNLSSYPGTDEEKEYMGVSHEDVGRALAYSWKLPEPLKDVIACHHNPSLKLESDLVMLIHIADIITDIAMEVIPVDHDPGFAPEILEKTGSTVKQFIELAHALQPEIVKNIKTVTNIITG